MKTIFLSFSIKNSSVSDYFIELAHQLSNEYHVIIITDHIFNNNVILSPKIQVEKWPKRELKHWRNFLFLFDLVKRFHPVMMISNFSSVNLFLVVGYFFRIKNRIAWCHSISEQFLPRRPFLDRKRFIYKLATTIIANSNSTKEDLIKNFAVKESKIKVYYNAVRKKKIEPTNTKKYQIVYVGRMDSSKGVETLIYAIPEVLKKYPKLKLKLIGGNLNGREIGDLKEKAETLQIENNIIFLGNQSKEVVLQEFSNSYLTVVPSVLEAFGYVVIESFSVKTPVIGSNTTGIAEIIRDGVDGFLFETQNSLDLAEKINKLLNDEILRLEFSQNCYERFLDKFEIEEVINKLLKDLNYLNY